MKFLSMGQDLTLVGYATASTLLPAIFFGAQILDDQRVKNAGAAIARGALIVLCAHTLLIFCMYAFGNSSTPIQALPPIFILSLVFTGWITFPAGCCSALVLYKLRGDHGPKGCKVHGYAHEPPPIEKH